MAMPKTITQASWYRHLFYRKQVLKTTWKFRAAVILAFIILVVLPRAFWARQIGQSLECDERIVTSDALLLENFDIDYPVFAHAAALQKTGVAARAFVPVKAVQNPFGPDPVYRQFAEVMAHSAGLEKFEIIPMAAIEPISLNAAKQIADFLTKEGIKSVVVVTPRFRSRRSAMVYDAVFGPKGIRVGCAFVVDVEAGNWESTWHGIQNVVEQFLKLQYYRFYVLL
jgi:hypothetical protein